MTLLSHAKNRVVPRGAQECEVRFGPLRGVRLNLDLSRQSQIWLGLYERETYQWLERFSRGIHTGIDIGANEGLYTSFFLVKTSAQRVWSFDGDPTCQSIIAGNLALNGVYNPGRWTFVGKCVGSDRDANTCALDSIREALELPCLVKMDVDGAELDVLRSGPEVLRSTGVRWLIETHSPDLESACLRLLTEFGYQTKVVPNAWWRRFIPETRTAHNRWLVAYRDLRDIC